ncbi:MAG: DUF2269 family protein [Actinomycetota bacterium]
MSLFEIVKFVHILSAIVAVGFNLSYGVLTSRSAKEPEHELHVLRTIKVLDQRFANVGYGILLATGIWMILITPYELTELWILLGIGLYTLATLIGIIVYAPLIRRQLAILQAEGPGSAGYRHLTERAKRLGVTLSLMVIVIVFLMVTKPTL